VIDHEIRKTGIGGSEVAALYGEDEFKTAFGVWASKKGGLERTPDAVNSRMMIGKVLEPAVLQLYQRMKPEKQVVYTDVTFQHPSRPFQVYSPDALIVGEKRGVEVKVVFWDQRGKWGWDPDSIPTRVLFQCWWYMAAMGYDTWDVVALIGEDLPRIYTIDRLIPAEEKAMLDYVESWWRRFIEGDEEPPLDNSEDAARLVAQRYPRHKRPDMREATEAETLILEKYVTLRILQRELKSEQTGLETLIKNAIGDREGLTWGDQYAFTWRRSKDGTEINYEAMALTLLHNFVKDPADRLVVESLHTVPKEGSRRIRLNHPEFNRTTRKNLEVSA
jgi:putative phage-type endonuclease